MGACLPGQGAGTGGNRWEEMRGGHRVSLCRLFLEKEPTYKLINCRKWLILVGKINVGVVNKKNGGKLT